MKKKQLMKMHLQFFAEGGEGSAPETTETPAINLDELNEEQLASIKDKFGFEDDDDVNKLIQSKHASWSKKLEAEKNEAARLAQLSEEERQQALIQKEKEEFEAEKAKFRQDLLVRQLIGPVSDTAGVSQVQAEAMLRTQLEERQFCEFRISPEQFAENLYFV